MVDLILSFSSVFVNGLDQMQSAAFSARSVGFIPEAGKSDRRKSSRSQDLGVPAICGTPEKSLPRRISRSCRLGPCGGECAEIHLVVRA